MDFARKVAAFAKEYLGKPFAWGVLDCNTLALDWASEVSGLALTSGIYGEYSTEEEAAMFAAGYPQTLAARAIEAGFAFVDTAHPRPGDLVIVWSPGDKFQRGHIAVGSGRVLSADETRGVHLGLVRSLPMFQVLRWRNA